MFDTLLNMQNNSRSRGHFVQQVYVTLHRSMFILVLSVHRLTKSLTQQLLNQFIQLSHSFWFAFYSVYSVYTVTCKHIHHNPVRYSWDLLLSPENPFWIILHFIKYKNTYIFITMMTDGYRAAVNKHGNSSSSGSSGSQRNYKSTIPD